MPRPAFRYLVAVLTLSLGTIPGWAQSATTAADQAVAYQINAQHNGSIQTPGLLPPLSIKWSVDLKATVGYPLIAEGKIFVLAADSNANQISLYALDPLTGATLWGPVVVPRGSYWWAAAAYDNGTIYVTPDGATNFGSGAMYAYSAATGDLVWSATLAGQYLFNSPPTAANGMVYTGGAGGGGTVYAVKESDGTTVWTAGVANGNNSSPAVKGGAVYVSYVCPQVYGFAAGTGKTAWHYSPGCDGGGGTTPALYRGSLYVRDSILIQNFNGIVFDASTGAVRSYFNSLFAPAFYATTGFYTCNCTPGLTAFDVTTGVTRWTASPPSGDSYSSPPIAVNGVVYIGTAAGRLLGYSVVSGKRLVTISVGAAISAYDYDYYGAPLSGLAAAQGLLLVPASTHLVAIGH